MNFVRFLLVESVMLYIRFNFQNMRYACTYTYVDHIDYVTKIAAVTMFAQA